MFAIQLQQKPEAPISTDSVTPNILPCRIHRDGPTGSLNRYWRPGPDEKDKNLQTAYFRGRKLQGRRVAVPEGYEGVVALPTERVLLSTERNTSSAINGEAEQEEPVKILEKQATFDEYVVWGHELAPAADDSFVKGVEEWLKLAEAMHCQPRDKKKSS